MHRATSRRSSASDHKARRLREDQPGHPVHNVPGRDGSLWRSWHVRRAPSRGCSRKRHFQHDEGPEFARSQRHDAVVDGQRGRRMNQIANDRTNERTTLKIASRCAFGDPSCLLTRTRSWTLPIRLESRTLKTRRLSGAPAGSSAGSSCHCCKKSTAMVMTFNYWIFSECLVVSRRLVLVW